MPDWLNSEHLRLAVIVETIVYAAIGLVTFAVAIWLVEKITPFSVRKEIEEDQNVALGIIVAAIILGVALILAAVLR